MLGKKRKRKFGMTESHTSFGGGGGYDYDSSGEEAWGSPDGRGGFGPNAKRRPKKKKPKREPGTGLHQTDDGKLLFKLILALVCLVILAIGVSVMIDEPESGTRTTQGSSNGTSSAGKTYSYDKIEEEIKQELLTENEYSRPGTKLSQVNGIVVHYVANPGSTAMENRDYFEGLAKSHETKASAHFIIDTDGTIVQCVPLDEVAYCSNSRNFDTISIECCHPDEGGRFTEETMDSLIRLCKWLMSKYKLKADDVIRHYDITGKNCPKYYVEQPEMWSAFLEKLK